MRTRVLAWGASRRRLIATLVVAGIVVGGFLIYRDLSGPTSYRADLHNAAGLRSGDEVRIAGITVGKVSSVRAVGAVVEVDFQVDRNVVIPTDTRTEVKLGSLLGQRFLQLDLGNGRRLAAEGTLPLGNAEDSYTLEQFWLDASPVIGELDLPAMSKAIQVLQQSTGSSATTKAALDGLTSVANLVNTRSSELARLVSSTRAVTDQIVAQKSQLTSLITHGGEVFALIAQRRDAVAKLLADGRAMVLDLTAMAKQNSAPMRTALTQLHTILSVLQRHEADLRTTLKLADPAMRLYVNSAGDGPWIGVNAPGLILPDSWWCLQLRLACS